LGLSLLRFRGVLKYISTINQLKLIIMKIYLLIKCYEDGDSYQTFSDLKEAKEVFEGEKKDSWYHTLALCEVGPNQSFGFNDYGFYGEGVNVIGEWSRDYGDE
jgi:hypothetical protein